MNFAYRPLAARFAEIGFETHRQGGRAKTSLIVTETKLRISRDIAKR